MEKLIKIKERVMDVLVEVFYRLVLSAILIAHSVYVLFAPTKGIDSVSGVLANWRKVA